MKMTLNFLGHPIEANVNITDSGMNIQIDAKEMKGLDSYLRRALSHFDQTLERESLGDLSSMIQQGIDFEASTNVKLQEPTTKLPYDIPVTTKEKLVELAEAEAKQTGQRVSQTHVLTNIIERKYAELFPNG